MKFIVTGGAGFIGSHVVAELLGRDHEVVVIDNFSSGSMENIESAIEDSRVTRRDGAKLTIHKTDIRELPKMFNLMEHGARIIHLAGVSTITDSDPCRTYEVNAEATRHLCENIKPWKCSSFVLASSAAVYGDWNRSASENLPVRPLSAYGMSKALAELQVAWLGRAGGVPAVSLRLFNVVGPRNTKGVVVDFCRDILNDTPLVVFGTGEQVRDFVSVRDVAEQFVEAAIHPDHFRPVSNVCTGVGTTMLELAKILFEIAGKELPIKEMPRREEEIRYSVGDPSLSEFVARVGLRQVLRETYDWCKKKLTKKK